MEFVKKSRAIIMLFDKNKKHSVLSVVTESHIKKTYKVILSRQNLWNKILTILYIESLFYGIYLNILFKV